MSPAGSKRWRVRSNRPANSLANETTRMGTVRHEPYPGAVAILLGTNACLPVDVR